MTKVDKNYRPASLFPTLSNVFGKIMKMKFGNYVNNFLSQYLCDYRKGFNTQWVKYPFVSTSKMVKRLLITKVL